jgi:hypothetical protein
MVRWLLWALFVWGCAAPNPPRQEPIQDVVPSFNAQSVTGTSRDFALELRVQEPVVEDTPILIGAILEYRGAAEAVQTWIAGGKAPIYWELRQRDGPLTIAGPLPGSCGQAAFERDRTYWLPYVKGAAFDPNGPQAEFYRRFLSTADLFLPAGEWEVVAKLDMALGTCTGPRVSPSGPPR